MCAPPSTACKCIGCRVGKLEHTHVIFLFAGYATHGKDVVPKFGLGTRENLVSAGRKSHVATWPLPSQGGKSGHGYITHAFFGITSAQHEEKNRNGPNLSKMAMQLLPSQGSPVLTIGRKSEVAT